MGDVAPGSKGCYVKLKKAWRLLKTADDENVTAYLYGVSGSGKTTMVDRYLGKRGCVWIDAGCISDEELCIRQGATRKIVVIDNIHELSWGDVAGARAKIVDLIKREDVWVILIGRCPVPPWLSAVRFQEGFYVIDSQLLMFGREDIEKYAEYVGFEMTKSQLDRMYVETTGLPIGVEMCYGVYKEGGFSGGMTDSQYDEFSRRVVEEMCNYLEYHVYDNWDIEMQEFLMEISIVDEFTTKQAEMVTGRSDSELLTERAKWLGNFMTSRVDGEGETIYQLQFHMRISMRRRLARKYDKERVHDLYENAGLYYRLKGDIKLALDMFEKAEATERIVSILVDNARRAPNTGYYYELKKYYLALPESAILKTPELMSGMSMLQSLLLDPDESERWYSELKKYADMSQGSVKKNAKSLLLYLDIALPHRGSVDVLRIIKAAYLMMFNKEIRLPEFSVTSNLPSQMNGGKDFCEWSKKDRELAANVGKIVEFVLGRYGKGLVNIALAESFLEKGGDNYEIATLAAKGRMQAEAGGKLEQCFVADGIQIWLHLQNGKPQEAEEILDGIEKKAENEFGQNLIPNIKAFKARCSLYRGDRAALAEWMKLIPDENEEFRIYDRFIYLTKVRVYLQNGRESLAFCLLEKLKYYASVMKRTYVSIECDVLMAITKNRMNTEDWKEDLKRALDKAMEYHFVRIISREGAAVYPLLKSCGWDEADAADGKSDHERKEFYKIVMKETEKMKRFYPGYLKAGEDDVQLSDTAISILKLQAEGMSRQQIADHMSMTVANVKYHLTQAYRKLGVTDKAGAVREATSRGIL